LRWFAKAALWRELGLHLDDFLIRGSIFMEHPLTYEQFREALAKGLGRAIQHIQQFGPAGLEAAILEASLTCNVFDPQCEGTRGEWLYEIMAISDDTERYRAPILDALRSVTPATATEYTAQQLTGMAWNYAEAGCDEARQALYERFANRFPEWRAIGAHEMVHLDGLEGLVRVALEVGGEDVSMDWLVEFAVFFAEEQFGADAVAAFLAERSANDDAIRAFIDQIAEWKARPGSCSTRPRDVQLDEYFALVEDENAGSAFSLRFLGRRMDDADRLAVFERLIAETRRDIVLRYLQTFYFHSVPRFDERLAEWAVSEDSEIQDAATMAMRELQDERAHDLAVALLERGAPAGICLLRANYRVGDASLIEQVLPNEGEPDAIHPLVLDIVSISSKQKTPELTECLRWAYELNPCSCCRQSIVEDMIALGIATPELLAECLYDSDDETRDLARAALG
jgi:hypothetical protein